MKDQNTFEYNNVQDSIPKATAGAGTISNANNNLIVGVNTAFLSAMSVGDFIYIKAQNDFREIENITSDTELVLKSNFGSSLSGVSYHITKPRYRMVSWLVKATGVAIIDGVNFTEDEGNTFEKQTKGQRASGDHIPPIDVDASTNSTTVLVTVEY